MLAQVLVDKMSTLRSLTAEIIDERRTKVPLKRSWSNRLAGKGTLIEVAA